MKRDLNEAVTNPIVRTFTYDMEKFWGLPKLTANLLCYKCRLSMFNEGIHSGKTDTSYCFIRKVKALKRLDLAFENLSS